MLQMATFLTFLSEHRKFISHFVSNIYIFELSSFKRVINVIILFLLTDMKKEESQQLEMRNLLVQYQSKGGYKQIMEHGYAKYQSWTKIPMSNH